MRRMRSQSSNRRLVAACCGLGLATIFAWVSLAPRADAYIYWASAGAQGNTIGRANNDGSGVAGSFIAGAASPCGVAVNSSHLYWGNVATGSIGRAGLDGSGANPSFIGGASVPCAPSLDSTHVYWANQATGTTDPQLGSIGRARLDGSNVQPLVFGNQSTFVDEPCGTAIGGGFLYWVNGGPDPRTIGRSPIPDPLPVGGFVPEAGGEPFFACWPSLTSSHIYWSVATLGIARGSLSDTSDLDLIATATASGGTAILGSKLYWANFAEGTVSRANLDGSSPQVAFLTGLQGPRGIAVDLGAPPVDFGGLKRNKKRGTAKLTLDVPMAGTLSLTAPGLKARSATTAGPEELTLALKPTGKARKKLARKGKRRFGVEVDFSPQDSSPNSSDTTVKLIRK
jgi:Low-density lipoprotein receptor repeat class B